MADHAWNAIDSHVYRYTSQELIFPFEEDEYAVVAEEYLAEGGAPADVYPHLNQLAQTVMAGEYDGKHDFEFGLEVILEGLERALGEA